MLGAFVAHDAKRRRADAGISAGACGYRRDSVNKGSDEQRIDDARGRAPLSAAPVPAARVALGP